MRFCPVCKIVMINTLREGVEIDYCIKCRGVWLDRNELEKIIDRVTQRQAKVASDHEQVAHHEQESPHYFIQHYPPPHPNNLANDPFLEEIFSFDD